MTYRKCTCTKVKVSTAILWITALTTAAVFSPMYLIPVALLALFNFAYLMLHPVPLPIVLSFVCMVTLSLYAVYMNTSSIS